MRNNFSKHTIKGMQRDLNFSKPNAEFSYENMNIRITTREDSPMTTITNERGNSASDAEIIGKYLGHAVINNLIIVFSKAQDRTIQDYITLLTHNRDWGRIDTKILYSGDFNFSLDNAIQALGVYESEDIQKVYWVDGRNQPRMINIKKQLDASLVPNMFEFIPDIKLENFLNFTANPTPASGEFLAGTIQYCCSYYNLFGQESNIFAVTPLCYIAYGDRGAKPNDLVSVAFKLELSYLLNKPEFDYIRIYSIHRTSKDSTPTVKVVTDISTNTTGTPIRYTYIDTGRQGYTIDPSELLYKGGEEVVFNHMCAKDNTLFLGNYEEKRAIISPDLRERLKNRISITPYYTTRSPDFTNDKNSLNFTYSASFKKGEWYRLGLQFQYKSGKWSEPVYIKDLKCGIINSNDYFSDTDKKPVWGFSMDYTTIAPFIQELKTLGFRRIRPIVVFPTLGERVIKCQGVVSPTLYSVGDRQSNAPFAFNSYIFRGPEAFKSSSYMHNFAIAYLEEIQVFTLFLYPNDDEIITSPQYPTKDTTTAPYTKALNSFYGDSNIVTFNSPDIEFDTAVQNINTANLSFRVIGYVSLDEKRFYYNVDNTAPKLGKGFLGRSTIDKEFYYKYLVNYEDALPDAVADPTTKKIPMSYFPIYLWNRNGSLGADKLLDDEGNKLSDSYVPYGILNRKVISRVSYSRTTGFYNKQYLPTSGISNVEMCLQTEPSIVRLRIKNTESSDTVNSAYREPVNYAYNIDKVVTPEGSKYPLQAASSLDGTIEDIKNSKFKFGNEPVSMKYKSTPHAVFAYNFVDKNTQGVLPQLFSRGAPWLNLPWEVEDTIAVSTDIIDRTTESTFFKAVDYDNIYGGNFLYIGELYDPSRDGTTPPEDIFGGTSEFALEENLWVSAGDPLSLDITNTASLIWYNGDTYFQRYECMKTYPFTNTDKNSVVEICSFMCETRVNLDGRYDRNKNLLDATNVNTSNFNLMNSSYTQLDTFFNYRYLNPLKYSTTRFPNMLTWTKTKFSNDVVDQWTNITLASQLELDGDKGEIASLNTVNNEILCFQPKGISRILYNSRVQVNASDNVPIEIANSGKVDGKVYISNTIGATNKWSIKSTPQGIYFMDGAAKDIYLLGNEGMVNITDNLGFGAWANENLNLTTWSPNSLDGFKTFYDQRFRDLYFINDKLCLCYSELIGQFTSFYSYENFVMMENLSDKFISLYNDRNTKVANIYWQNEGDYNRIQNKLRPYHITFISNNDPHITKVFNVLEYKLDMFDLGRQIEPYKNFDYAIFENNLQYAKITLDTSPYSPTPLKKKFNTWRCTIPRDQTHLSNKVYNDRFRSSWLKVTLHKEPKGDDGKLELYDLLVHYFE